MRLRAQKENTNISWKAESHKDNADNNEDFDCRKHLT